MPFLWHPGLYHCGKNLTVSDDGAYALEIRVESPTFERHDEENGDRYAESVEGTFEGVDVEAGQD